MTDERNKDLVRRHFEEIWNRRDLSACEELMAKDFVEHAAAPFTDSPPGEVDGPEAMRGTVEWLVSQFPDIQMTIEALVADGDIVVARVTSEGTHTGKLNGFLPPSGKRFRAQQSHWFRVQDGKLAEHWPSTGRLETTWPRCCSSGSSRRRGSVHSFARPGPRRAFRSSGCAASFEHQAGRSNRTWRLDDRPQREPGGL